MDLQLRISAFAELGNYIRRSLKSGEEELDAAIRLAEIENAWFVEEDVRFMLGAIADWLTVEKLTDWTADAVEPEKRKKVLVIMAGNIPLVGFHDFLSVLIAGHAIVCKMSKDDSALLKHLISKLLKIEPEFSDCIMLEDSIIKDFDAAIATGSNNTARYFEQYFGHVPTIIRKNRSSIAVLSGNESVAELESLGQDVFRYFGLGCRSISKVFVPKGYSFDAFFEAIVKYGDRGNHAKFHNNYMYHRSIYLLNQDEFLDNNFLIVKEDEKNQSPIGCLFYEYYDDIQAVDRRVEKSTGDLQCVIGVIGNKLGCAQKPSLDDYADNINTLMFLNSLNKI